VAVSVSETEREYLRRIGAYKALSHAEAAAEHAELDLRERLRASWDLFLRYRSQRSKAPRDDDPSAFYARARSLGLAGP
jgi:hypothetical protein